MPSLEHLIDHYSRFADGLPFKLCHPLFKVLKAKDPTYALGKFIFIGKLLFDKICNSLYSLVILGRYFGMIFFGDSNSSFEDSRGGTWSGHLPKIIIYPNFETHGRLKGSKI